MATMRLQASTASSPIGGDPAPKQAAVDQVAVGYLAKAFIAVDISLNGRNFELKRNLPMETPPKVRVGVQLLGCSPQCGSGLARECGVSASKNAESESVFTSKSAPTGGMRDAEVICY